MRIWLLIACLIACLPAAADGPQPTLASGKTQRLDFPSGGTLRLEKSIGTLTIEGWSRPDMEITTTQPDNVRISVERQGSEVIVETNSPKPFPPRNPFIGGSNFSVEYTIMVPSSAKLTVHHQVGQVNVDGLSGDVEATLMQGEMLLHLPQEGHYVINANSDYGTVNSDFPGMEQRRGWFLGHRFISQAAAPHRLNLRVLSGDIVILAIQEPKEPPPLAASKGDGK